MSKPRFRIYERVYYGMRLRAFVFFPLNETAIWKVNHVPIRQCSFIDNWQARPSGKPTPVLVHFEPQ